MAQVNYMIAFAGSNSQLIRINYLDVQIDQFKIILCTV